MIFWCPEWECARANRKELRVQAAVCRCEKSKKWKLSSIIEKCLVSKFLVITDRASPVKSARSCTMKTLKVYAYGMSRADFIVIEDFRNVE